MTRIGRTTLPEVVGVFGGLGGSPAAGGTVYVVGGGPGDPGLLTLRAAVLLSTCDVVAYDRLAPSDALHLVPDHAERVCVGKRSGETGASRSDIHDLLVSRAQAGRAVVRLKGGDPFVFGRGGEEVAACHGAGVPVEVVSGVSAAMAVPAAAGIPLTHRSVSAGFAVVTGHEDPGKDSGHLDWDTLARFPGTLVFLMGLGNIARIATRLVSAGRDPDTPVALVRWGTMSRQETIEGTLASISHQADQHGFGPPAVAVVGEVVRLRGLIAWRERLPLLGVSVLILRTLDRSSVLASRVRALGGEALETQVMHTQAGDEAALSAAVADLAAGAVRTLVVSSPPAVVALADALATAGLDVRTLAGVRLLSVGSGAARGLQDRLAVRPDLSAATLRDLADTLEPGEGPLLVFAQDGGDQDFVTELGRKGFEPVVVAAYRTRRAERLPDEIAQALERSEIDLVAVASSSSARHFAALAPGPPGHARIVTIGPRTTAACLEAGLRVDAEAHPHDYDGLVDALVSQGALARQAKLDGASDAGDLATRVESDVDAKALTIGGKTAREPGR
ncbi:MAG: uroporphyrinogen-III C-methyltransferase [Actinomycetota bacterium]|nr:uroporphyrinogen-III C-methyltransferase [Actinomycetota bacterium]